MNTTQPAVHAAITRVLTVRDLIDAEDPDLPATCRAVEDLVRSGADAWRVADHLDTVERLVVGADPWVLAVAQEVIDAVKEVRGG